MAKRIGWRYDGPWDRNDDFTEVTFRIKWDGYADGPDLNLASTSMITVPVAQLATMRAAIKTALAADIQARAREKFNSPGITITEAHLYELPPPNTD